MSVEATIKEKLVRALQPTRLDIVNEALAEELRTKIHALAIRAYAPGEAID